MYNYITCVKRLNDKFKKQENTEIVDNTTPEDHPPQTLNDNTNETQPIPALLNQNSFNITNNIEHNKAENMRDPMMLKKQEIKEAEMENFISDMLKDKNLIDLINKDSETYESIIDGSNKAIIILGQEKEDLNLIANFLKDGELILESNEYGDWDFSKKSLTESSSILDSFYIKNEKYLTYKSSYLDAANSSSESTIDKFFLQKILSTTPTKFILAIKNIETKNSNSSLVKANLEKLVGIFEQFTKLLRYIDINEGNLSIVVTDSPASNNNTRISKIIDDTIKLGNFSDEQKIIINKIKDSIYLLPQASEQAKDYKDLLNIIDENYIIPDEYNKITIDGENLTYILNAINVIDKEILISINEFKTYIEKKWKQNIESNLSFEDISAKTDKLKQLIDIVNCYKQLENNAKTIGSFLETVKKLNQLLETPKSENKLENLLNYLKYLSDIKFSEKENLVTINSAKWFNDLFSNLGAYNIKEKLLESFKHTICKDKDSFYNKLNETIEKFYEDIKNNDILDLKAINNIYNLKNFLQHINNSSPDIENLDNIKLFLTKSFKNFNNVLGITINNSISNLEKLIGSVSKQEAKSLWKYITASKSITEISRNLDEVIYDKLLHKPVLPDQELPIYNLLEKLLKETHKSINDCYKNENLYKHQLAEIYCGQAQIYTANGSTKLSKESIELYENAANLGSEEANIKLGKIEFKSGNYVKALEYFKTTTHISYAKEAFNKLLHLKESELKKKIQQKNPQDIAKLTSEIIELYSSQGDFYNQYNLDISEKSLQDSLKVFCLNTKALIEEQGRPKPYGILYDLSKELTSMISAPCSQLKFIQKTEKYKNLAEKFKEEKLETDYTNITASRSHDSYFKEPLLKSDDLNPNTSFKTYYDNNEDSSNMLGAYYNSSEYTQ